MVGWKTLTLGELCKFENGDRGKNYPGRKAFVPSGIPFINAGHLDDGEIDWHGMDFIPRDRFDILGNGKVQKRDLLFCLRGSLGKFGVVDQDIEGAIASSLVIVRPGEILDCDFLAAYFRSTLCAEMIAKYANGAAQPNLSAKNLKEFKIPLPPLPEQKRIVAILDEVFAGIDAAVANTKKNLANARELFESYLNAVFTRKGEGWVEKTLKEVSKDFGRGKSKHRPRNDPKLYGGKYPFIQTGDVRNCNHIITESSQTYNDVGLAQSKLWPKGTICITIAANIAETGILEFDSCFPDSVIGIVVNDVITTNEYVEYLLQAVKARIKAKGKGSAQDNINLGTFEKELFPFPDLDEQHEIVESLNCLATDTQRLESIYQQKLAALAELKQSILQKAFAGELTAKALEEAVA
jgi:type I restriction enzyme S subunit